MHARCLLRAAVAVVRPGITDKATPTLTLSARTASVGAGWGWSPASVWGGSWTATLATKARKQGKHVVANDDISHAELQLVGENGEMIGLVTKAEALALAKEVDLDVCLVGSSKGVPIARIASSQQLQEAANTKAAAAAKAQEAASAGSKRQKEIRLGANIARHDLEIKLNKVKALLAKDMTVKVVATHSHSRRGELYAMVDQAKRSTLAQAIDVLSGNARFADRIATSGNSLSVDAMPLKAQHATAAKAVADALIARLEEPVTKAEVVKPLPATKPEE